MTEGRSSNGPVSAFAGTIRPFWTVHAAPNTRSVSASPTVTFKNIAHANRTRPTTGAALESWVLPRNLRYNVPVVEPVGARWQKAGNRSGCRYFGCSYYGGRQATKHIRKQFRILVRRDTRSIIYPGLQTHFTILTVVSVNIAPAETRNDSGRVATKGAVPIPGADRIRRAINAVRIHA